MYGSDSQDSCQYSKKFNIGLHWEIFFFLSSKPVQWGLSVIFTAHLFVCNINEIIDHVCQLHPMRNVQFTLESLMVPVTLDIEL